MKQVLTESHGDFSDLQIRLDREVFMDLVVTTMESMFVDTVGSAEAGGFISLVGLAVGKKSRKNIFRHAAQANSTKEAWSQPCSI